MFAWLFEKMIGFEGKNLPLTMAIITIVSILIPISFVVLVVLCAIKYLRS